MSRTQPSLKTLEVRKQLLVAEAEVLRQRLGKDLEIVRGGFTAIATQAKSIAAFASIAATVLAAFSAFRRAHKPGANGKSSLLSNLLAGARTASTVWMAFRSHSRRQ